MSLIEKLFGKKPTTASVAKERLKIILSHERATDLDGNVNKAGDQEWLAKLQNELLEVIAKYTKINQEDLKINVDKRDNVELLEINVTLPEQGEETK